MVRRSEHLDCGALRIDEERDQGQRVFAGRVIIGSDSGNLCLQLVVRGGRGVANVDGELQVGIDHVDGARDAGQRIEVSVGRVDSDGASVGGVHDLHGETQEFGLVLAAEVVFKRIAREHANGVDRALGQRCVAALARGDDLRAAVAGVGYFEAGRRGKLSGVCLHDEGRLAGDGIGGRVARGEVDDIAVFELLRRDQAVETALFAVAHREFGVGREQERGSFVVGEVIAHVFHGSGFLVGAYKHANSVGEFLAFGFAALGEELHGVQRNDKRAFVVEHAAADKEAVAALHGPRVARPADAWHHNVGVANHAELGFAFALEVGPTNFARLIGGREAQARSQVERRRHAGVRVGAAGVLGRGGVEVDDAWNSDEIADFFDDLFPMGVDPAVGFGKECRVFHFCHNPLVLSLVRGRWLHFSAWRCPRLGHAAIWASCYRALVVPAFDLRLSLVEHAFLAAHVLHAESKCFHIGIARLRQRSRDNIGDGFADALVFTLFAPLHGAFGNVIFVIEASQQIAGFIEFVNARAFRGVRCGVFAFGGLRGLVEPCGNLIRFNDGFVFSVKVVDANGEQACFIYVEMNRDFRNPRCRPANISKANACDAFAIFRQGAVSVNDMELHCGLVGRRGRKQFLLVNWQRASSPYYGMGAAVGEFDGNIEGKLAVIASELNACRASRRLVSRELAFPDIDIDGFLCHGRPHPLVNRLV